MISYLPVLQPVIIVEMTVLMNAYKPIVGCQGTAKPVTLQDLTVRLTIV